LLLLHRFARRLSKGKTRIHKKDPSFMQPTTKQPLFDLGQLVATPGALTALEKAGQNAMELLSRHVTGDWGDIPKEDRKENQYSDSVESRGHDALLGINQRKSEIDHIAVRAVDRCV
jgi:hypothetical protein